MGLSEDQAYVIETSFGGKANRGFMKFSPEAVSRIADALREGTFSPADAKHIKDDRMSERHATEYISLFQSVGIPLDDLGRGPNGFVFLGALSKLRVFDKDIHTFGFDNLPTTSPAQHTERVALIRFMLRIEPIQRIALLTHTLPTKDDDDVFSAGETVSTFPELIQLIKDNPEKVELIARFISERGFGKGTDSITESLRSFLQGAESAVAVQNGWL